MSTETEKLTRPFEQRSSNLLEELGDYSITLRDSARDLGENTPLDGKRESRNQRMAIQRVGGLKKPLLRVSDTLSSTTELNYEQLWKYHSAAVQDLSSTTQKCFENYSYMRGFHKKLADQIIRTLKSCEQSVLTLEKLLHEYREVVTSKDSLMNLVNKLQQARLSTSQNKEVIKQRTAAIQASIMELERLEADFAKLQQDDEMKIFNKLSDDKSAYQKRFEATTTDITTLISSVEKAIKKFTRLVHEGKKTVDHTKILEQYAISPFEAMSRDHDARIILYIVRQIRDSIMAEELELKDVKKQKTLASITELETQLPILYQRYHVLEAEGHKLQDRISQIRIAKRIQLLKDEIIHRKNDISLQQKSLAQAQKNFEESLQKAETHRQEVEIGINDVLEIRVKVR